MSILLSFSFGTLLRQYRQAAGLSQEALAERARLSRNAIDTLERGVRRTPRKATLALLAEALALTPSERATLEAAARRSELATSPTPERSALLPPADGHLLWRARGGVAPQEAAPSRPWLTHLPAPLTALVGREQEVQAVCGLLSHPEVRLLTITGTAGVGKTRLALEVARRVIADFSDGVCFVPLAPVSDPAQVLAAIAQALGLWEAAALSLQEQVPAALRDRYLLLLVDNFEQVLAGAPQLASLLASCPLLRVLVTSRTALHLSGEHEFAVLPLAVPNLRQPSSPETLLQGDAVRLFMLRAQAIQPGFHVTLDNARVIAEICVRLDGLPLAIELAAGRSKLLPPQALLKRLSHRLEVLTGGAQDLPLRQQTLRNTLQWSYDLLSQEEQRLFRWLSIFVGGCTLEAAEAVCQAGQKGSQQASSVLDGVASLLDKSLMQQTEQEGDAPRLVMLETMREFGLESLEQHGELEAARQAHARYYLALVESAEPYLFGPEQLLWLARLERDLDNLLAILQAAMTGGEDLQELALRLGGALQFFWLGRGYQQEGRSYLERLLQQGVASPSPVRIKALIALGAILWGKSDAQRLAQVADEVLTLARGLGDNISRSFSLMLRGSAIMMGRGDAVEAQACLEEALSSARAVEEEALSSVRAVEHRFATVTTLLSLGRLAWYQQDGPRAIARLEESVALCRAVGEKATMSDILVVLARAELDQGHITHSLTLLEESLTIYRAYGFAWGTAVVLGLLGQLAFKQGKLDRAEALLKDCARLASEAGDRRRLAQSHLLLAGVAALRGDHAAAREQYEAGLAIALDLGHTNYLASGLKGLGCVAAALGLPTWAAVLWGAAEPLRESRSVAIPEALYERMVAVVHNQLGGPAFEQARARGRTMTAAQALASPEAFASPMPHLSSAPAAPGSSPGGLTAREMEVLRLVAQGLTNLQIAEQLTISVHTVNTHVRSTFNKLEVNSRTALTRFAIEHHLL